MLLCRRCGKKYQDFNLFCPYCGSPKVWSVPDSPKEQTHFSVENPVFQPGYPHCGGYPPQLQFPPSEPLQMVPTGKKYSSKKGVMILLICTGLFLLILFSMMPFILNKVNFGSTQAQSEAARNLLARFDTLLQKDPGYDWRMDFFTEFCNLPPEELTKEDYLAISNRYMQDQDFIEVDHYSVSTYKEYMALAVMNVARLRSEDDFYWFKQMEKTFTVKEAAQDTYRNVTPKLLENIFKKPIGQIRWEDICKIKYVRIYDTFSYSLSSPFDFENREEFEKTIHTVTLNMLQLGKRDSFGSLQAILLFGCEEADFEGFNPNPLAGKPIRRLTGTYFASSSRYRVLAASYLCAMPYLEEVDILSPGFVPYGLSRMEHLKKLKLTDRQFAGPGGSYKDEIDLGFEDSALPPNLEELELVDYALIDSADAPFSTAPHLKRAVFRKCDLTQTATLGSATGLESLVFEKTTSSNCDFLENLSQLQELTINDIRFGFEDGKASLEFIGNLPSLQYLDLSNTMLEDLTFLKNASKLEVLIARDNNIQDAVVLETLPSLKKVDLSGNPVAEKEKIR